MMTLNASMEKSRIKVTIQCDVNGAQDEAWVANGAMSETRWYIYRYHIYNIYNNYNPLVDLDWYHQIN